MLYTACMRACTLHACIRMMHALMHAYAMRFWDLLRESFAVNAHYYETTGQQLVVLLESFYVFIL